MEPINRSRGRGPASTRRGASPGVGACGLMGNPASWPSPPLPAPPRWVATRRGPGTAAPSPSRLSPARPPPGAARCASSPPPWAREGSRWGTGSPPPASRTSPRPLAASPSAVRRDRWKVRRFQSRKQGGFWAHEGAGRIDTHLEIFQLEISPPAAVRLVSFKPRAVLWNIWHKQEESGWTVRRTDRSGENRGRRGRRGGGTHRWGRFPSSGERGGPWRASRSCSCWTAPASARTRHRSPPCRCHCRCKSPPDEHISPPASAPSPREIRSPRARGRETAHSGTAVRPRRSSRNYQWASFHARVFFAMAVGSFPSLLWSDRFFFPPESLVPS